jgi:hypothetical protein
MTSNLTRAVLRPVSPALRELRFFFERAVLNFRMKSWKLLTVWLKLPVDWLAFVYELQTVDERSVKYWMEEGMPEELATMLKEQAELLLAGHQPSFAAYTAYRDFVDEWGEKRAAGQARQTQGQVTASACS